MIGCGGEFGRSDVSVESSASRWVRRRGPPWVGRASRTTSFGRDGAYRDLASDAL